MNLISKYGSLFVMAFLGLATSGQAAVTVNVPYGSTWKYFIGTQEASSPIDAWRGSNYNDTAWSSGPAFIGYANPPNDPNGWEASIATSIPFSSTLNYVTLYTRRAFEIVNKSQIATMTLSVRVDDGFVAFINGIPVATNNAPAAPWPFNAGAPVAIAEGTEVTVTFSPTMLVNGTNILAIEVFQNGTASSDLLFDATLSSTVDDQAPFVISIDPPAGSFVPELKIINVLFNESVTGVNAADLLINNVGATNVTVNSPRDYSFTFPEPPTGAVTVAWASGHGITDLAGVPNAFVGAGWGYTLEPGILPTTVYISEFMADNENGIQDEDGTSSDWLELYNPGPADINLGGWFLTDATNILAKWRFPALTIGANRYLLIWASEKNKTNPAAPLHTNFRLSNNAGSYLALLDPQTNVVSAFASYPAQSDDISYGRDRVDPRNIGYFVAPTPGAQNSTSGFGFAPVPTLSLESGVYTNASLTLTITVPPGATVVYTLDGTLPTNGSPVYTTPLTLSANVTVKARALKTGLWPSPVQGRTFVFLDSTTRDFNSNLPVLILSTEGRGIPEGVAPGGARAKGVFVVYDTFRGRSSFQRRPDFQGHAEFEIFGQTSAGFPKKPYNVEIQDELGNDKAESILGMPAEADWKLRNPYSDKCLMNDFLAYEMFEQMGNYSVRRKLVEVFVDTGGARLSYPGDYVGVEVFLEKIERDKNRVDIAELTPSHTNEPSITGGYIFKRDKPSPGADLDFSTTAGTPLKLHEPKPRDVNNSVNHPQVQWLRKYLSAYETAVNNVNWTTLTGTNHYSYYIDVDTFVDQHWIVEFPKQIDGYRISNFFSKDRNGKVKNVPIWDWNLSFGNADYLDGGHTNEWYYTRAGAGDHLWLRRLVGAAALPNSGGDPDFIQKIIDRWGVLRTNVMNGDRLTARIDEIANLLTEAAGRNFSKYIYLDAYQWPNPDGLRGGEASNPATSTQQRNWDVDYLQPTYAGIISEMKKWTRGRYNWVDSQFQKAPTFSQDPGNIQPGTGLSMTAPAGTIYYTLDGTDPRQSQANGAVAPGALTYSVPLTLNDNVRVFARARVGTVWSPPTIATYVVHTPRLVITEIMYHPQAPPAGSTNTDEDFEYVEVKNVDSTLLNLNRFRITGGIEFNFPSISLAPGSNIVVVANQAAFQSRYGSIPIAGVFSNRLDNAGERLVLEGPMREPILDFSYDDDWYPTTDGLGFSLVVVNDGAPAQNWGLKTHWRASGVVNGSPGQNDPAPPAIAQVVINEALTHSDPPAPTNDVIELRNLSGSDVNIGGWFLSDDFDEPKKFRIPNGTIIGGNGFLTFSETNFNVGGGGFSLSSLGDDVYLFSGDANTNLTGYYHGYEFEAQKTGVTFGRHVISTGDEHFVAQTSDTLGSGNAGPLVGAVVINEIMYRPPDVFANGAYWNNSEDEYIELYNRSASSVNLYDASYPSNTWKLDKAVEFQFPTNTTIPAGGYLLVVSFDPVRDPAILAAFRSKYGIPGTIPVLGPYDGNLSNGDEAVALYMPDQPVLAGPDAGTVPQVLVEQIRYSDSAPWPPAADGQGASLQRVTASAYGNDPANWVAAVATPGAALPGGTAPTITLHPTNRTVLAFNNVTLNAAASGSNLRQQWRFNGNPLVGQTNGTLALTSVQPSQAGVYQFVAFNGAGSASSSNATLTVVVAARITQQPTNVVLRGSTNFLTWGHTTNTAVFTVSASSASALAYQWRHNGNPLPGATNSFLSIVNPTPVNEGNYDVVITDNAGPVVSSAGALSIIIPPVYFEQPSESTTIVAGDTVTFTVGVTGTPPFGFRWRRDGIPYVPFPSSYALTITNVPLGFHSNKFSAVVTNIANLNPGLIGSNAFLYVLADTDGDKMPDSWEIEFGLNPTNSVDGTNDLDGDTMINRDEWIAGTDPMDPESYLKVDQIEASGGASLQFLAISNKSYTIQYTHSLESGDWTRLTDVKARTDTRVEVVVDPTPGVGRYYRLVTPKLPPP